MSWTLPIPRSTSQSGRPDLRLAIGSLWLGLLYGALIFLWPRFHIGAFPLPTHDFDLWPRVGVGTLWLAGCIAVWLSVPRWHSERNLKYAALVLFPVGVVLVVLWAPLIGLGMTEAAREIWSHFRHVPPPELDTLDPLGEPIACLSCGATIAEDDARCDACGS